MNIPDVVAYPIEEAIEILESLKVKSTVAESYGRHTEKNHKGRVIRQRVLHDNVVELIVSFF